jgi:hypothetical protein
LGGEYQREEGEHKERVNEGQYGGCENRRMKPVEIVLRRREEGDQWRG